MSAVIISGDSSGTITLQAPAVSGSTTINLPATSGTATVMPTGYTLGAGNTSSFKNRIINGDMRIDQRNAGASLTPTSGQYLVDRWAYYGSQTSKFTAQQNQGSVTPPEGFTNYQGVTSSSAYSSVSGDFFMLQYGIEGYNVADLGWGTTNAKTVTLSFWVRSSLTGQFGGCIGNSTFGRSYPFTYTISSANTWTQISITIPGDTTGTYNTTNGAGIFFTFDLGCGSTYLGTAGSWSSGSYRGATGDVKVVGTSGATFYVTGVQLEIGSTATSFDYRDYGRELILCQRYYQLSNNYIGVGTNSATINGPVTASVVMRTSPTMSTNGVYSMSDYYVADATQSSAGIAALYNATPTSGAISMGNFSGITTGRIYMSRYNNSNYITMSAEL